MENVIINLKRRCKPIELFNYQFKNEINIVFDIYDVFYTSYFIWIRKI